MVGEEEFDADETEEDDEGVFEVAEPGDHAGQGEVHGAEAEDGEDIGGKDEEGFVGDGEDGGDGIDGEEYIGGFDNQEGEHKRGDGLFSVETGEEFFVVEVAGNGVNFTEESDHEVAVGANFFFAGEEDFQGGEDEQSPEDVNDPFEFSNKGNTGGDHKAAHDQRAHDAPEEGAVLIESGDGEEAEDQGDDEDIIEAEGHFDEVAGDELNGGIGSGFDGGAVESHVEPVVFIDKKGQPAEGEGEGGTEDGPAEAFADGDDVGFAVEYAEVDSEHDEDESNKSDPEDELHSLGSNQVFCFRGIKTVLPGFFLSNGPMHSDWK